MQLTQAIVAEHLDLNQSAVSRLLPRLGVGLEAGLDEIRTRYIRSLRSTASAHGGAALQAEKLKLTAARRKKAELDLRERAGELVESTRVRLGVTACAAQMRSALERLPDMVAPRLAVESDESTIVALLAAEIDLVLADLAARFRAGKFLAPSPEAGSVRFDGE
jgi:phage terminase Nu1 subunit (DNA packaging protein)